MLAFSPMFSLVRHFSVDCTIHLVPKFGWMVWFGFGYPLFPIWKERYSRLKTKECMGQGFPRNQFKPVVQVEIKGWFLENSIEFPVRVHFGSLQALVLPLMTHLLPGGECGWPVKENSTRSLK